MSRLYALLFLVAFDSLVCADTSLGLCNRYKTFCECLPAAHPSWTIVNCTVPRDQTIDILEGDVPESTTNLIVTGAESVLFGANSLAKLQDARHIYLSGNRVVLMRKFAAINLNVISVYLEIEKSDILRIEESTFSNIKGPLSVSIRDCDYVKLEGAAFSWLLTMSISNVRQLQLNSRAFKLDRSAANVGEHGPGMTIELKNLTIPEFPEEAFGSSAAGITMEGIEVRALKTRSFSANTYNTVLAVNCSFALIESDAFAQNSLINNLHFYGCKIHQIATKALLSAVASLNISHTRFEIIDTGAINATIVAVVIQDSKFNKFMEKGFVISSWNKIQMERNSFDELPTRAVVATSASVKELVFSENEIETANAESLMFIGHAYANSAQNVVYKNNYFGTPCHCNITPWLVKVLDVSTGDAFMSQSYCTVDEFFARCFNEPEQNMLFKKFLDSVCNIDPSIKCEQYKSKKGGNAVEIKNPRFPHKSNSQSGLSDRDKKVIGIVIVTALGCAIIAMFVSFIRWMRRKGYCVTVKNFLISSNSSCGTFCDRFCACGMNSGLDNAGSISQLSVNEYSERHRLNEPRAQDLIQETTLPDMYTEQVVPVEDKTSQTLPEELTKELLETLKEKLEDPENYVEAREMIEHLYELIKVEESCNTNTPTSMPVDENIYELPFQNTTPRIGKNKKQMISVGTRTPSLDKLTPLSPYNRQTALAHEYFEPKDFAVHLYAEIANCDKDKKSLLGVMPDVVGEQAVPRGPYLRAVREKIHSTAPTASSSKSLSNSASSPQHSSTIKSNKSTASNSSGKMINRPLPEKPISLDPGEGTSFKHG
ncbi:uncharacterized protein LOC134754209 [Cydia strobilella]|uniref:uncharacterized protein LOC134754209 n=1 Tax=Cydia strobilella TaxID=1100964 RepID=UPI003003BF15